MCDPLTAISLGVAAASAGGSLYEGSQAASQVAATRDAQNQANAEWVAYQTRIHQQQVQAEDLARQKATGVQQSTLQQVGPQAQEAEQGAEAQRLNTLYNQPGAGEAQGAGSPLLSGEATGNARDMNSLTAQVNQATSQARSRIQALATANSYGGSFGGLGTTVPIQFAQGGNAINLQNAIRQGNLKTYGVEQQVQPINYAIGPGTESTMSLSKGLGQLAGSAAGFAGPRAVTALGSAAGAAAGGADATGSYGGGGGITNWGDISSSFNNPIWNQWGSA